MSKQQLFMREAINLALKARGKTSPNPLVGAVLVKGNKIVGRGYHKRAGAAHAEIMAIRSANGKSKGATLYVTLEPCGHFGKTPPCVDAVIKSGVKKVVIATKDLNPLNNGKSIVKLRKNSIKVESGLLKNEALMINEAFNKFITKRIPFVTVKVAQTLDGKIALGSGESQWITNKSSRDYSHRLRKYYDAILVGVNTVLKDNPLLKAKNKVIVDSFLRTSVNSRIFTRSTGTVIIATTAKASKIRIAKLKAKGATIVVLPAKNGRVNLRALMRILAKMEITNIFAEGGGSIIGSLLDEGLVDKTMFFISPKVFGGKGSISSVQGEGIKNIASSIKLKNISIKRFKEDILVEGNVKR